MNWIEICLALPKKSREQPINVAHLKLLLAIAATEGIKTDELLPLFENEKPTLISRLNFLVDKGLINKLPKFNRGGNKNPNYFTTTRKGRLIAGYLNLNSANI